MWRATEPPLASSVVRELPMYDYSKKLLKFYSDEVAIDSATRSLLRDHRRTNEDRVKDGLAEKHGPKVNRFQIQGGYAMHTVVQHPKNDYDIDNGVIFAAADLVGSKGADMSALDARKMVRDAVNDGKFKTPPVVKPNCVRVFYEKGHHVDLPVYREKQGLLGNKYLEIASADWKRSDPAGVNAWFKNQLDRSPDNEGDRQFRRVVTYLKALGKSRESWNAPSGFMFSILVAECYVSDARDDLSLVKTLRKVESRLKTSLKLKHPVVDEYVTDGEDDPRTRFFRDKVGALLEDLSVLDSADCDEAKAATAWDTFFRTEYFTKRIKEAAAAIGLTSIVTSPSPIRTIRDGERRYG